MTTNYNISFTSYPSRHTMVVGVAGDWYFESDAYAGFNLLQENIKADDFSEVLEPFESWNSLNPDEAVTTDDIRDAFPELLQWYDDNYRDAP